MQLQLKPTAKASAQPCGVLLRGTGPEAWLRSLQGTGINLAATQTYGLPGATANTVWGCLLLLDTAALRRLPPSATYVQCVAGKLFIPLHATLYPMLAADELKALLKNGKYFIHPETGMVPLEEAFVWQSVLRLPPERTLKLQTPAKAPFVPQTIRRFEVAATPPEEGLQQLEDRIAPERKTFADKPLNPAERIKLALYRQLFAKGEAGGREPRGWVKKLENLFGSSGQKLDKIEEDLDDLERRNASEMDKLLRLLRESPEEALKYAVPLDDGTGRGSGRPVAYNFGERWRGFSLFGPSWGGGGGGSIINDDYHERLRRQYNQTAEALIEKEEWEKAAFVYLKLLKDYRLAASTLERGGLWADAAAVHLRYTGDKAAAAHCYERANMLSKAIELHTELGQDETAGDLWIRLQRHTEAMAAYEKAATRHLDANRIVKAAALRRLKMNDLTGAQNLLLDGWRRGADAYNCLHGYFANTDSVPALRKAIDGLYREEVSPKNAALFLSVLKGVVGREAALDDRLRTIAIDTISTTVAKDPSIVSELRHFNKENALIGKDIMRYKVGRR